MWFYGRSDSVQTVEDAQQLVVRLQKENDKQRKEIEALKATRDSARATKRKDLVHDIVALQSYRDSLTSIMATVEASLAAKNAQLAEHDMRDRSNGKAFKELSPQKLLRQ
eukprot:CAMPEP_0119262520 /NCGR_PEP_ID=MMETSP1329-20130426/2211_1 /TAXON_ID=114041 /ORGANISM="Genus nov. species nov., Strain RCC1024" /LENGTH=109 /DNA_ID=CAMNT_0007262169 /DNA_START=226 /DNA_END=552 /DNA_ORIENTATION=-